MVGAGSQKLDNLDAGDIELDFDDGQYISYQKLIDFLTNWVTFPCLTKASPTYFVVNIRHLHVLSYITYHFRNTSNK